MGSTTTGQFAVRLDFFDGPVDLLLHLVKQNELPIEKVSLALVAEQYVEYLETWRKLDLEIAGEYLVIAATLLSIKSSVLLNEPPSLVPDEEGNLIDPHDELLEKLRAAAVYREGAEQLGARPILGVDVFAPKPQPLTADEEPPYADHDPLILGRAFMRVLKKLGSEAPLLHITVDSVSIVQRMVTVLKTLEERGGSADFEELIPTDSGRAGMISAFLALLELAKRTVIRVHQAESFDRITISLASRDIDTEHLTSEFDESQEALGNG